MEEISKNNPKVAKKVGDYIINALNGMAQGLFASLIIGLIIKQIGTYLNLPLLVNFGLAAQYLTGPAIGLGVALFVGAPKLGVLSAAVAGAIGAGTFVFDADGTIIRFMIGEPVGALLASLVGAEIAKLVNNKTKVNIMVVPIATIIAGGLVGVFVSPFVSALMKGLGMLINTLTTLYPLPMGILVATVVGMVLTLPISSAAICISLGISGLAAGAATVGCSAQMIGFAVISYKENKMGGLISQGIGTSMLQVSNIIHNPLIWIPPTLTAAIIGPLATVVFKMQNNAAGAGMGTSGLVGQFNTVAVMGPDSIIPIILLHFLLPAVLSLIIAKFMRKKGWIKDGDMKLFDD
ncbi:MAG: PTS transporter subunit IIC [Pleomorphochaeta sp.]